MKSKVYFTSKLEPQSLIELYKKIGKELPGNVAVKLHSGEKGNKNYLRPEFVKDIIKHVNGTVVECNTAYPGARNTTKKHTKLMEQHGWSTNFNVDILDSEGEEFLETKLVEDLDFDSLSMMMMSLEIEEAFGFRFEEMVKFETVGEVCSYLEERVG